MQFTYCSRRTPLENRITDSRLHIIVQPRCVPSRKGQSRLDPSFSTRRAIGNGCRRCVPGDSCQQGANLLGILCMCRQLEDRTNNI
jgi:hypothetical protein